jgi:hypothetical protein
MEIEKITVVVGKEKAEENYQLIIGDNYYSIYYNPSYGGNHDDFIRLVSEKFANQMVSTSLSSRLDVLNGYIISNERLIRVNKLPDTKLLETELIKAIVKLSEGKAITIPVGMSVN